MRPGGSFPRSRNAVHARSLASTFTAPMSSSSATHQRTSIAGAGLAHARSLSPRPISASTSCGITTLQPFFPISRRPRTSCEQSSTARNHRRGASRFQTMPDRSRAPIALTAVRIDRTDWGGGTLVIHDEGVMLSVQATPNDRPIRIAYSMVNAIDAADKTVALTLRDGTRILMACGVARRLREELLFRARSIPEVTRTLRAFGSARGQLKRAASASDQQKFFAPLLEARRHAGSMTAAPAVLAAFDAPSLAQAIAQAVTAFAAERFVEPGPERRALEAVLTDLAEPLIISLHALAASAEQANASIDDLRLWRQWSSQLRATFEVADRVWVTLDSALDTAIR